MISLFKSMLGLGPTINFKQEIANGAVIVDVRTKGEFAAGHIQGSLNIPLNELEIRSKKLGKNKMIITCCASGIRSAAAKSLLRKKGFDQVQNGGGWTSLLQKIQ